MYVLILRVVKSGSFCPVHSVSVALWRLTFRPGLLSMRFHAKHADGFSVISGTAERFLRK
ncbi:MAG: hypothetical protein EA411_09380 [Saprospirales bacterium]|nr:MAG: hypothetical protein EA411_09380 [Saprospirales bacterium]